MYTQLSVVRRHYSMKDLRSVHLVAIAAVQDLERCEARVITALQECDRLLVYRFIGYGSLLVYATEALGLTKDQAYTYINVARKAAEIPAFHDGLMRGDYSVSKARRVVSVLTHDNCQEWLTLLKSFPKRAVEQAVSLAQGRITSTSELQSKVKAESTSELKSALELKPMSTSKLESESSSESDPESSPQSESNSSFNPNSRNDGRTLNASDVIEFRLEGELARRFMEWLAIMERETHRPLSREEALVELMESSLRTHVLVAAHLAQARCASPGPVHDSMPGPAWWGGGGLCAESRAIWSRFGARRTDLLTQMPIYRRVRLPRSCIAIRLPRPAARRKSNEAGCDLCELDCQRSP